MLAEKGSGDLRASRKHLMRRKTHPIRKSNKPSESTEQAFEHSRKKSLPAQQRTRDQANSTSTLKQELERTSSDWLVAGKLLVDFLWIGNHELKKNELDESMDGSKKLRPRQEDLDKKIEETKRVIRNDPREFDYFFP